MCSVTPPCLTSFLCFVAHNVTVEEILSSYKQACQKLNCKPIPKVLKQIQVSFTCTSTQQSTYWNRYGSVIFKAAINKRKGFFLSYFINITKHRFQIIVEPNILPVSPLMDHCSTVLKSFDRVGSQQNHSSAAFHPFSLQHASEVAGKGSNVLKDL